MHEFLGARPAERQGMRVRGVLDGADGDQQGVVGDCLALVGQHTTFAGRHRRQPAAPKTRAGGGRQLGERLVRHVAGRERHEDREGQGREMLVRGQDRRVDLALADVLEAERRLERRAATTHDQDLE